MTLSCQSLTKINEESIPPGDGLIFICPQKKVSELTTQIREYLASLKIRTDHYKFEQRSEAVRFVLTTLETDTNTLNFHLRPEYEIQDEILYLPTRTKKLRKLKTVSKKEIVLALMQHGRRTEFSGNHCSLQAFQEHVGVRQNVVAWTEKLSWIWPNGGYAFWNKKYWDRGNPVGPSPLHEKINDMFINQRKYSIGCYAASKVVFSQGVLDYYHRVNPNPIKLQQIEARLMSDNDPLVQVEPARMWSFEKGHDPEKNKIEGKILTIKYGIAAKNIVPGDWLYLLNTDSKTYLKLGYEGSNAIYLGRNKLDDYYNDHNHSYQFHEKIDEVYQWRNGVFSRSRHGHKRKPLTPTQIENMYNTPDRGGLMLDLRVFPYYF